MSKKRELLKRVVEYMWVGDIVEEIKELLAQPEQTEQEPVAWMYEWAVRDSFDGSFTGEWKEEISRIKPDGVVKGFNPTKLESTVRNLIPLYKAHNIGGGE